MQRAAGRLDLDAITFRYHGAEGPALDSVSIAIEPGETVALVGPSGSSKTTIAGLIPRFHDPENGQVRLDGVYALSAHPATRLHGVATWRGAHYGAESRTQPTLGYFHASLADPISL